MHSTRSVVGGAAVLAALGMALPSCATGDSTCAPPPSRGDDASRSLSVLEDDLSPLREAFNGQSDQWRAVALVSPTCSECVLGAEVVKQELTDRYAPDRMGAFIVWIPMLPSDNEQAARSSATIFPSGRAEQFYDAHQSLGWAYARQTFAGFMQRARLGFPDEDPLAEAFDDPARQQRPQWDLYMLYAPGVKWQVEAGPPMPTHWIRHCGRQDGKTSTYWRDTPDTPPQRGDLYEAMRAMADEALGPAASAAARPPMQIEILGFEGCPNTPRLRVAVEQAVALHGQEFALAYVDQGQLPADDLRRGWPAPTVLVEGHDLFGMAPPQRSELGCRMYPGGLPGVAEISDALETLARR